MADPESRRRLSGVVIILSIFLLCSLQSTFTVFYSLHQQDEHHHHQELSTDHSFRPTTTATTTNTSRRKTNNKGTRMNAVTLDDNNKEDDDDDDDFIVEQRWSTINNNETTTKIRDGDIHLFTHPKHIDVIRIIGERHSGTTFFEKYLKDCLSFDQHQQQQQQQQQKQKRQVRQKIQVVSYLVRKKHWFQPTPNEIIETVQQFRNNNNNKNNAKEDQQQAEDLLKPTELDDLHMLPEIDRRPYKSWIEIAANDESRSTAFNTSLILLLVRNPYDWIEAMRLKPHHWPNHVDLIPLDPKSNTTNLTPTLKRVDYHNTNINKQKQKQVAEQQLHEQQSTKEQPATTTTNRRRRLMDKSLLKYRQRISTTSNKNNKDGKQQKEDFPHKQQQQQQFQRKTKTTTIQDTPQGTNIGDRIPSGFSIHKSYFTKSTLDWKGFIHRPMKLIDYDDDDEKEKYLLDHSNSNNSNNLLLLCQKGFRLGTVSPCKRNITYIPKAVQHIPKSFLRKLPFDINDVVYEQRQPQQQRLSSPHTSTSQPSLSSSYSHPMELRADKIVNFLNIATNWDLGGFGLIQYENILGPTKLRSVVVDNIFAKLKIEQQHLSCPSPDKQNNNNINKPYLQERRRIPNEFKQWITDNTEWNIESLIGYYPET